MTRRRRRGNTAVGHPAPTKSPHRTATASMTLPHSHKLLNPARTYGHITITRLSNALKTTRTIVNTPKLTVNRLNPTTKSHQPRAPIIGHTQFTKAQVIAANLLHSSVNTVHSQYTKYSFRKLKVYRGEIH